METIYKFTYKVLGQSEFTSVYLRTWPLVREFKGVLKSKYGVEVISGYKEIEVISGITEMSDFLTKQTAQ